MVALPASQNASDTSIDAEISAVIEDLLEEHQGFERAAFRALALSYLQALAEIQAITRDADRACSLGYLRGLFSDGFRPEEEKP